MDQVVEDLLNCLDDPALALLQWSEAFGVVQVLLCPCDPSAPSTVLLCLGLSVGPSIASHARRLASACLMHNACRGSEALDL